MKVPRYIVKNYRNQYYFRIHVYPELVKIVGKRELRKSLRTTCPIVASERAKPLILAAKTWFEKLLRENNMARKTLWEIKILTIDKLNRSPDGSLTISGLKTDGTPEDQETLNNLFGSGQVTVNTPNGSIQPELLSERLELFIDTKQRGGKGFNKKTEKNYRNVVDLFIEVFGDHPMHFYTEKYALNFRDILLELPPNARKKKENRKLSIDQLIELDGEKLSSKRVHDQLVNIRAIWQMAVKRQSAIFNIFDDIDVQVEVQKGKKFDTAELQTLFDPANMDINRNFPSHYWALCVALWTGMRRSEIFFRTIDEIKHQDNIWYFDITRDGEKETKNKKSVRWVPIHSDLISLGFLDYIGKLKNENPKSYIFPEYSNYAGQAGNKFTDFFIAYRRELGVDSPGKKFHSFRNTFISELERKNVYTPRLQRLVGHATGTITHDSYGDSELADLSEAVEKADFSSVMKIIPKWRY